MHANLENQNSGENTALKTMISKSQIKTDLRTHISQRAVGLVKKIRDDDQPGMMELFLTEYGLSSDEGVALMCLAEALLRVPDAETMDALIEDKIAPGAWGRHLGQSHSPLINASTWALFVTGKVLGDEDQSSIAGILQSAVKRVGEPVIRHAVKKVMGEMGRQFVLGEDINSAMKRARELEADGYTYSYDMLGEAACTKDDAKGYFLAYGEAISQIAKSAKHKDTRKNPGISIKLSALHPRYETIKKERVMKELMPLARSLSVMAKSANIGLNIDAEEAGRLDISLDIIEAIISDPCFEGWDGFGIVVQAYNLRAPEVLDRIYQIAKKLNRKLMVRLVKGAYWDSEIKLAQVEGHDEFPVYTRKSATDISYICCAKKLLAMSDHIYPQFATHNAHTVAAILELADDKSAFEFQRLHGMGEALHNVVLSQEQTRCRIYAPVGAHKDLLAYLVRRLLENGANSSFVNQIVDKDIAPEVVARDPFDEVDHLLQETGRAGIKKPSELFLPERVNSNGWDFSDPKSLARLEAGIEQFDDKKWNFLGKDGDAVIVKNPCNDEIVGSVRYTSTDAVHQICSDVSDWGSSTADERSIILDNVANLFEENEFEFYALLMREAGKTLIDCVGEIREAVDFLRYYAKQAKARATNPAGVFTCISPWNFPLAIFTGQISAALAAGNGVVAKPAESTCLIAQFAMSLFWRAGVPEKSLKLVLGLGSDVGNMLSSNPNINGICFTGSTQTAQLINRRMADHLAPDAPLIAETGGLNAMIVDSTALPQQAVKDIVMSAFQSAGQRCSALRIVYLQDDIAEEFTEMLFGAMDELEIGDPRKFSTDVGPIINEPAASRITDYINLAARNGKLLKQLDAPENGIFVGPSVIKVEGIGELEEEIFGPVLHIATFANDEMDKVIDAINNKGYGLTFGIHSRIDDSVEHVIDRIEVGNIYVNRNQIGAVVGSQPFGGVGLSGTGPKAGGPRYLDQFMKRSNHSAHSSTGDGHEVAVADIERAFLALPLPKKQKPPAQILPGPTGESNQYLTTAKRRVLCLGPTASAAEEQAKRARSVGCVALAVAPNVADGVNGRVTAGTLTEITELDAVICWADDLADYRSALAQRAGAIVPLLTHQDFEFWLLNEQCICIDTTAAGGNVALLSSEGG